MSLHTKEFAKYFPLQLSYKCIASCFATLSIVSSAVNAAPTVAGSTISWPDDGWYQVQTTDTNESICEGGSSCEVSVGSYTVINLSSGERFNDVIVSESVSAPSDSGVQVSGNTLSWPDDGWYQVQSVSDNSTICEGTRSCEVANGTYVVINHSTGVRFENIEVGGSDSVPTPVSDVSVSGNTINLPNDGWYQVQSMSDYSTVCEGTYTCEVANGTYVAINHSTGVRYENIEVSGSGGAPTPVSEVSVSGNTINLPNDGWYQVQSLSDYSTVCEGTYSCEVANGTYVAINHSTGVRYENIEVSGSGGDTPATVTEVSVVGNTISWPDDGWYQVQDQADNSTQCEGGRSCAVSNGVYTVINLTSGQRFENIAVSGSSDTPSLPVATANNVVIAGVPYKQSRAWLNSVVTGKHIYSGNSFESYFTFALSPAVLTAVSEGSSTACVAGGSVSYGIEIESSSSGASSFSSVAETFNYSNCGLPEGTVDGVITVTTLETVSGGSVTTDFNVTTTQPTASTVLSGTTTLADSAYSGFNPVCGSTSGSSINYSLALRNSTLAEITDSGLETHYYATLDHAQNDAVDTSCSGESRNTQYASSASYTHTSGDSITRVDATKTGGVSSIYEEFYDDDSIAQIVALIDAPDGSDINMKIAADNSLGNTLIINASDSLISVEFTEDLNFRNLSDL